jgi:phosphosulfolactate synthase
MGDKIRADVIGRARYAGFDASTQVKRIGTGARSGLPDFIRPIKGGLSYGVSTVAIAPYAAKSAGGRAAIKDGELCAIADAGIDANRPAWQAPTRERQAYYIFRFGNNVNLTNVGPDDVIALEKLRCGVCDALLRQAQKIL